MGGLRLLVMRTLFVLSCFIVLSPTAHSWWSFTPGDTVDNSTQLLAVKGYHPDQPIPFPHKLHASDRGIPCEYCHSSARRSISAGIPPLNTCMGCHKMVNTEAESIKKLKAAFDSNQPIQWTKVHDLPDFVRFSHKVHVLAKDAVGKPLLDCQTCHGQVQGMLTAEQYAPLQMGWCVECHNKEKIPAQNGKPAVKNASVSCNTCHF